ncbi:hypothetical protein J4730_21890 [Klebsiella pneumoniae]|uniref:Uncharacterized protein n=1 Tax=Klebsiella pneumoniae TaxID=573 RepID=A0A939NQR3_KLEPN|nr:hypothetical protein [Klebsiella pneumoniae]
MDGLQYERYFGEGLSVPQPAAMPLFDTAGFPHCFCWPRIIQMSCAMDISESCVIWKLLCPLFLDIVVFCTHGTGGSSEEQYECWAAGWSVCFAAFQIHAFRFVWQRC